MRVWTSFSQSFAFCEPKVWNSPLSALRDSGISLNMFGWRLKT